MYPYCTPKNVAVSALSQVYWPVLGVPRGLYGLSNLYGLERFELLDTATPAVLPADSDHSPNTGDSIYFNSAKPRSHRGLTEPSARAIVVSLPPRI
jgi:hypothetical protein